MLARVILRRALMVLLLFGLIADVIALPVTPYRMSTLKHGVLQLTGFRLGPFHPRRVTLEVQCIDGALQVISPFLDDEQGPYIPCARVYYFEWITRRGSWAPTYETVRRSVEVIAVSDEVVSAERAAEMIAACSEYIQRNPDPLWHPGMLDTLQRGASTQTRLLWRGFLHNALSLAAATLLLLLCVLEIRRALRRRRVRSGFCESCGYPLPDLDPNRPRRCSECGRLGAAHS